MIALSGLALIIIGWLTLTPGKAISKRDALGITLVIIGALLFNYSAAVLMWRIMP